MLSGEQLKAILVTDIKFSKRIYKFFELNSIYTAAGFINIKRERIRNIRGLRLKESEKDEIMSVIQELKEFGTYPLANTPNNDKIDTSKELENESINNLENRECAKLEQKDNEKDEDSGYYPVPDKNKECIKLEQETNENNEEDENNIEINAYTRRLVNRFNVASNLDNICVDDGADTITYFYYKDQFCRNYSFEENKSKVALTNSEFEILKKNGYKCISDLCGIRDLGFKSIDENVSLGDIKKFNSITNLFSTSPASIAFPVNKMENCSFEKLFVINNIAYLNIKTDELFNICKEKYFYRNNGYIEYSESVYKRSEIKNLIKEYVNQLRVYESCKPFLESNFYNLFPLNLRICPYFKNEFIPELIHNKIIQLVDNKIIIKPLKITQWCEELPNFVGKDILELTLKGYSQDNMGKIVQKNRKFEHDEITKQNVSQKLEKVKKYFTNYEEDKYKYLFINYDFTKKDFCRIFSVEEYVFEYLKMRFKKERHDTLNFKKDKKQKIDLEAAINDENISAELKEKIKSNSDNNYIKVDGFSILKNKKEILLFVLKNYCTNDSNFVDVKKKYNSVIENYFEKEEQDKIKIESDRYFEAVLNNSKDILCFPENLCRYYSFEEHNMNKFYENLNLELYKDCEISTLKIYRDNERLMEEFDIHNEYELHNLLRKTVQDYCNPQILNELNIQFIKNPTICFGNGNKEKQLKDLIAEYGPIKKGKLAELYESYYGSRKDSLVSCAIACVEKYYVNGEYKIEAESFTVQEQSFLRDLLVDDFYFLDFVKNSLNEKYNNFNMNKITNHNLKEIGYVLKSNYIISAKYSNPAEYFTTYLLNLEQFNRKELDEKLFSIVTFRLTFYDLIKKMEIIEISEDVYITSKKLEELNLSKDIIYSFTKNIKESISENEYFSVSYILNKISDKMEIDKEIILDNYFLFESLLKIDNENYTFKMINNTAIFVKKPSLANYKDFLTNLIINDNSNLKHTSFNQLMETLKSGFGVNISEKELTTILFNEKFYVMGDNIYINYDVFIDELSSM